MAKTEVILTHNILGLGAESDQVKVASGYARNYLIPHGKAIPLTGANKRRIEALRKRRAEREAHEFNSMSDLAKSVSKLTATLKVKTGDDGKLFGSVTAGMIADELRSHFDIHLDRKKIHLEHPIRTLGQHEVQLHLHGEINATLKVVVESLTKIPDAAAQAQAGPAEGKDAGREADAERKGRKGYRGGARGDAPERTRSKDAKE